MEEIEEYIIVGAGKKEIKYFKREDLAIGTKQCHKKWRTWRMSSRRSRRKFKNVAGKKAKVIQVLVWNRTRTKAREVSRGGVPLRGGPGCLKLPL